MYIINILYHVFDVFMPYFFKDCFTVSDFLCLGDIFVSMLLRQTFIFIRHQRFSLRIHLYLQNCDNYESINITLLPLCRPSITVITLDIHVYFILNNYFVYVNINFVFLLDIFSAYSMHHTCHQLVLKKGKLH